MNSLMDLVNALVEQESQDAVALRDAGSLASWGGSDEARAARKALEERVELIERMIEEGNPATARHLLTGESPE